MNKLFGIFQCLHIPLTVALIVQSLVYEAVAQAKKEEARIIQVIDGDTIIVTIGSRREHVRLIGIDTPESRPNRRSDKQSRDRNVDQGTILRYGHQAASYTRSLLPKRSLVLLEFDVEKRDHYQRLLAYVWRPQETMVNEEIVRAGYGYLLTVPPNVKYRERLAAAFSDAGKSHRGLWSAEQNPPFSRKDR